MVIDEEALGLTLLEGKEVASPLLLILSDREVELLLAEDDGELVTGALELEGELDETLEMKFPLVEDEELVLGVTLAADELEENPCLLLEEDDGEVVSAVIELDVAEPELLVEACEELELEET